MATSTLQHEALHKAHVTSIAPITTQFTLFPAPSRRPQNQSRPEKMQVRRPVNPRAPPSSPRNLGNTFLKNQNAERLAEVCRVVPAELRRGQSISSGETTPTLTDDHTDSDASFDEDRYQTTMSELWDTYHTMSSSTRYANQEFTYLPSKPILSKPNPQLLRLDRTWANDVTNVLEIAMPSPALPVVAAKAQSEQQQQAVSVKAPEQNSRPLLQQSPTRRRSTRHHPNVLSTIPLPSVPLPAVPHTAPLPYPHKEAGSLHVRSNTAFETWPPRSSSSTTTIPTLQAFGPTLPAHPPLCAPLRTDNIPRPSTAPAQRSSPLSCELTVPPVPALEKSVWEDDDDEEVPTKGHGRGEGSFSKMLHIRNTSNGSKKGKEAPVCDPTTASTATAPSDLKVRPKRTASEVFRSFFGVKKSAEV